MRKIIFAFLIGTLLFTACHEADNLEEQFELIGQQDPILLDNAIKIDHCSEAIAPGVITAIGLGEYVDYFTDTTISFSPNIYQFGEISWLKWYTGSNAGDEAYQSYNESETELSNHFPQIGVIKENFNWFLELKPIVSGLPSVRYRLYTCSEKDSLQNNGIEYRYIWIGSLNTGEPPVLAIREHNPINDGIMMQFFEDRGFTIPLYNGEPYIRKVMTSTFGQMAVVRPDGSTVHIAYTQLRSYFDTQWSNDMLKLKR